MVEELAGVNPALAFLGAAILIGRTWIAAWRWRLLLLQKGLRFGLSPLTRYYFVSRFFNFFLPSTIGGELARGFYVWRAGAGKAEVISSMIVERLLGLASLLLFAPITLAVGAFFVPEPAVRAIVLTVAIGWFVTVAALIIAGGLVAVAHVRLPFLKRVRLMSDVTRGIGAYSGVPGVLLKGFLLSVAFQFSGLIGTWCFGLALDDSTGFLYYLVLLPIVWTAGLAPITINGLGVREGLLIYLLGATGMPHAVAGAIALLFLAQLVAQGMIGGVLFLLQPIRMSAVAAFESVEEPAANEAH